MLRPSDRNTNRMARFVMRTHAVPIVASANGSTSSTTAISAMPPQTAFGLLFRSASLFIGVPSALRAAGLFALGGGPARSLDYAPRCALRGYSRLGAARRAHARCPTRPPSRPPRRNTHTAVSTRHAQTDWHVLPNTPPLI